MERPVYLVELSDGEKRTFRHITDAINYAQERLYMTGVEYDKVIAALRVGAACAYTDGSLTVTLSATAPFPPSNLKGAAEDMYDALKLVWRTCGHVLGDTQRLAITNAINKAEGKQ
jgi:hypothetical protein